MVALACGAGPQALADSAEAGHEAWRDRGLEYLKRDLHHQAVTWLRRASKTSDGAKDFRTMHGLARAAYGQLVLETAFPAARAAAKLADTERQKKQAGALVEQLETYFAGVRVEQAPEQRGRVARGFIHLEDTGGLISQKKKERFRRIRAHFKQYSVSLPITLYLPFGEYTANLAPFEIKQGETAGAVTFLDPPKRDEGVSLWWYVGGAAVVASAAAVTVVLMSGEDGGQQGLRVDEIHNGPVP